MLSLELSSACNANCIMCPHGEMTRPKENMSIETLKKVIADCQGKPLKKINLFWFGDSFCNKNIIEYLRVVRKGLPGVRLYISTNAGLLKKEISEKIIDEELLDVINFDVDGINKETLEKIRRNLNYEEVIGNIEYFLNYKKEKGKNKPETRITIIRMVPTEKEIDAFVKHWKPLVDKVDVNDYNTWLGTKDDLNVGECRKRSLGGGFNFACLHPWDELVISADGQAGLCCLDYDLKAVVGDAMKESIEDIWRGETLNGYRKKMLELDYGSIEVCKNCNAYIYQENKWWAKLQR